MQVPLDAVDLQHVSLLYTQGEMAAVAPIYDYDFKILTETMSEASWRQLLFWLGPPGLVIGALALFTLKEPRSARAVSGPKKPSLRGPLSLPFLSGVPPEPPPGLLNSSSTESLPLLSPNPTLPSVLPYCMCFSGNWCLMFMSGEVSTPILHGVWQWLCGVGCGCACDCGALTFVQLTRMPRAGERALP